MLKSNFHILFILLVIFKESKVTRQINNSLPKLKEQLTNLSNIKNCIGKI